MKEPISLHWEASSSMLSECGLKENSHGRELWESATKAKFHIAQLCSNLGQPSSSVN